MPNPVTRLILAARSQLHFFLLVIPLTLVMTWPAVTYVFDGEPLRVPTRNTDIWMKVWDAWHLKQALAGDAELFYTDALFYPQGLSLAYQNFSLPHMFALGALSELMPLGSALTLAYLLIVIAAAFSAYICIAYFLRDKWMALLGAVIFGFSQHVVSHVPHPDVNLIVTLPLSVYFFQRGLDEGRLSWFIASGVTVGLTAFLSIYILVCASLTLGVFVLGAAVSRWRQARFWLLLSGLAISAALVAAPRIIPMITPSQNLAAALEKSGDAETGTELLAYFVNYQHPVTAPLLTALYDAKRPPFLPQTSYLGYAPLVLIALGLARKDYRRQILCWLALALPFLLLRLGAALTFNNVIYADFALPKALLNDILPALFRPFHAADHFQMGVLLPLALMACYGLKSLSRSLNRRNRAFLVFVAIAIVAFEYYGAFATRVIQADQIAFINWLDSEEDQDEIRLINLPMGRQPAKEYALHQALAGYPHAEGLTGRTDPDAYNYIESNLLLSAWRGNRSIYCTPLNEQLYRAQLRQLEGDGFSHIVWHRHIARAELVAGSFLDADAAYADDYVSVFRLADMASSCANASTLSPSVWRQLQADRPPSLVLPLTAQASILSVKPETDNSALLLGQHQAFNLNLEDLTESDEMRLPSDPLDADEALAANSVSLLVYEPGNTDPAFLSTLRDWAGRHFSSCGPILDAADLVVEYFIRSGYPCGLGVDETPLQVRYANDIELANATISRQSDSLTLNLMWKSLPRAAHVVSLQVFDEGGDRVLGTDFTFRHKALSQGELELSSLPSGNYSVRVIVYDFASGVSVPGLIVGADTRFERAFEIDRITVE